MDTETELKALYADLRTSELSGEQSPTNIHDGLLGLLMDIFSFHDHYPLGLDDNDKERASLYLNEILKQCDHLRRNPGLFKLPEAAQKFFTAVGQSISEIIVATTAIGNGQANIDDTNTRLCGNSNSKPWNKYLRNIAPEERASKGVALSMTKSLQLLPPAASKLMYLWTKNQTEVESAIQQTNPKTSSHVKKQDTSKFCWDPKVANHPFYPKTVSFQPGRFRKKMLQKEHTIERSPETDFGRLNRRLGRSTGSNPPPRRPNRILTTAIFRPRKPRSKSRKQVKEPTQSNPQS